MQKQLTSRQTGLILLVAIISNKLLLLPGILSFGAKNDAWIVVLFSFVIDFLFLLLFLHLANKIDEPLFLFLQKKYGKAVAICFAIPVCITFAFKCVDIFGECYLFFDQVMYVNVNQMIFMSCFIFMILYLGSRSWRTLGRTCELLFFVFAVSLFLSFYMSINSVNLSNILPFFSIRPNNLFSVILKNNLWFGDFVIMFLLVGNIKIEKNTNSHIMISYFAGEAVVLLFVVIFICVFGRTSAIHKMAIIDITENAPRITTEGRLNWMIDLIFPLVNILGLGIFANAGTKSLEYCLPKKISTNIVSVIIFAGIVCSFALISNISYPNLYKILSEFACYVSVITQYILPIFLLILCQKGELFYDKKVVVK